MYRRWKPCVRSGHDLSFSRVLPRKSAGCRTRCVPAQAQPRTRLSQVCPKACIATRERIFVPTDVEIYLPLFFKSLARVMVLGLFGVAAACGSKPDITYTQVTPAAWQISGIANTPTFTVTTDVLHFGGTITKVTASVEGQNLSFDLTKQSSIAGGEQWSVSTQLTLWSGISAGTYFIDITAADSDNTTVTQSKAATVTVTD